MQNAPPVQKCGRLGSGLRRIRFGGGNAADRFLTFLERRNAAIRRSTSVSDQAHNSAREPDASTKLSVERTVLSYERTMLSWVRTATSLITFGFSIDQFLRITGHGATKGEGFIGPHEFGMAMIIIGLLALLLAALQNRWELQALKIQYPLKGHYPDIPRSRARVLAALIAMLGLLVLFDMLFRK
jgi:putative membrane protein